MAQTIRLTITPELEKALTILRQATLGTLNTTELIKLAVGSLARQKAEEGSDEAAEVAKLNKISAQLFYQWAKEDGTLDVDNISHKAKLKPFVPEPYVRTRKS
jgi:hypothetical protein